MLGELCAPASDDKPKQTSKHPLARIGQTVTFIPHPHGAKSIHQVTGHYAARYEWHTGPAAPGSHEAALHRQPRSVTQSEVGRESGWERRLGQAGKRHVTPGVGLRLVSRPLVIIRANPYVILPMRRELTPYDNQTSMGVCPYFTAAIRYTAAIRFPTAIQNHDACSWSMGASSAC